MFLNFFRRARSQLTPDIAIGVPIPPSPPKAATTSDDSFEPAAQEARRADSKRETSVPVLYGEVCTVLAAVSDSEDQDVTCKLVALHTSMCAVARRRHLPWPAPVQRRHATGEATSTCPRESLRHQAKRRYRSEVGEMFSPKSLVGLAHDNGFDTTRLERPGAESYLARIVDLVQNSEAPVVSFALANSLPYRPDMYDGCNEHSAVVAGFIASLRVSDFILCDASGYHRVRADDLLKSTQSLPLQHRVEFYRKIEGRWEEEEYYRRTYPNGKNAFQGPRRASAPGGETFQRTLIVAGSSRVQGVADGKKNAPNTLCIRRLNRFESVYYRISQAIIRDVNRPIPHAARGVFMGVFIGYVFLFYRVVFAHA